MATITIHNIDHELKARLHVRAALNGRSIEDEARDILRSSLSTETAQTTSLVESIRSRVKPLGGIELELPRQRLRNTE